MKLLYIGKRDAEFKFDDQHDYCQVEFSRQESLSSIKRRLERALGQKEPFAAKFTDRVVSSSKAFGATDGIFCVKWSNND